MHYCKSNLGSDYKTFKEIPLEVAFAADSSASESARGQVTFTLVVSTNLFPSHTNSHEVSINQSF